MDSCGGLWYNENRPGKAPVHDPVKKEVSMNKPYRLRKATRVLYFLLSPLTLLILLGGTILGPSATIQAAPAQRPDAITTGEYEQSDFSPHLKASYGEELLYTIRYTITTGTAVTGVSLQDSFGDQSNYLRVEYVAGSSVGPVPMNPDTPDVPDVVPTVDLRSGHPLLTWALLDISNTSGNTWVYEVRYNVIVYWDSNGNNTRQAISTATLGWSGGSAPAPSVTVALVQPANMTFNKTQQPPTSQELDPGADITWTLSIQNQSGDTQGTAYDLIITDTMPTRTTYTGYDGNYPPTVIGQNVYWNIPSLAVGATEVVTIFANLPTTQNVAHDLIQNRGLLLRSSAPGSVPQERVYTPAIERTTTAYVRNISVGKMQRSPTYGTANSQYQVVAGESVTITVAFTVPRGIILYNPTLRILLEDGLTFTQMIDPLINPNIITLSNQMDPWRPGGNWRQLEWANLASITNTDAGPVVVTYRLKAQARQNYFTPGHTGEVPHNTTLDIVPIVRWSDNPQEQPDDGNQYLRQRSETCTLGTCPLFVRPDLRYQGVNSGSYFGLTFPGGDFEGGAQINLTLHLRNRTETVGHPTAYETVLTDTLSPGLTYVSADPVPTHVIPGSSGTVLVWETVPAIDPPPDEETFLIVATLPVTMPAGMSFTTTAQARYTTFAGVVADEGEYLDSPYTTQYVVTGGYGVQKTSETPHANTDLYVGDIATYTAVVTMNPGIVMYQPQFDDLMPKGFHYITGSLVVNGGTMIGSPWTTAAGDSYELHWVLDDVDNRGGANVMTVQIRYRTIQTGINAYGGYTFAGGRGDFVGRLEAKNTLDACWHTGSSPSSPTVCLPDPPEASVYVIQPWLADTGQTGQWTHTRTDLPKYNFEVGETVHYRVDIKNTGRAPAYDIAVTETLPVGLAIQESSIGAEPTTPPVALIAQPPAGATGLVTWVIDQLAPNQVAHLYYITIIQSSADACAQITATAFLNDYTSQIGSPTYDRHYKDFDGAFGSNPDPIPAPKAAPYISVMGVCLQKTDSPDPVAPGNALNYLIDFGNTSQLYGATNVRITDTYDANTSFVNYQPSDPTKIFLISHYTPTHTIVFGINSLPPNGTGHEYNIALTFNVNLPFDQNDDTLTNYAAIDGQGDRIGRVERWENTHVTIPFLLIEKTAEPASVLPGELITYTLLVRNIGEMTAHNVIVEETYDPNVTYVESTPPPSVGDYRWLIASLSISQTYTITLVVRLDRPVNPDLASVSNRASVWSDEVLVTHGLPVSTGVIKPNLILSTTDSQDPVPLGGAFAYTVRYTNTAVLAHSGKLTVTLDSYVTYNTAAPLPGNNCAGGSCVWSLGDLDPMESGQVVIFVTVQTDIPPGVSRLTTRSYIGAYEVGPRQDFEYTMLSGRAGNNVFLPLVTRGYHP
jgi:uncharacterized repeat protein (TIGR01451 family)